MSGDSLYLQVIGLVSHRFLLWKCFKRAGTQAVDTLEITFKVVQVGSNRKIRCNNISTRETCSAARIFQWIQP